MAADVLGLELRDLGDVALGIATVLGGAAALLALAGAVRGWYRRTLGRRRDRFERLARLGTRAQLSFFGSVLGEPPAMSRTVPAELEEFDEQAGQMVPMRRTLSEHFFIDRDYYVQAICDEEASVMAFSVTTRSKRFAPTFSFPPRPGWRRRRRFKRETGQVFRPFYRVRLGRTRFSDLTARQPRVRAEVGARTFSYTELYYFGNPGYYQHFGFTASSAAYFAKIGPIREVVEAIGRDWTGGVADERGQERLHNLGLLNRFRRETRVTTFTVIGPHLQPEDHPVTFGPHGDDVRTLP